MSETSATEASKRFADLLDAVEHRGETFTVVRRGRVVATITSARRGTGADVQRILAKHPPDDHDRRGRRGPVEGLIVDARVLIAIERGRQIPPRRCPTTRDIVIAAIPRGAHHLRITARSRDRPHRMR